jgi:hypothetical protein
MKSPFRSIRQKLFNEGKLVRYLGYAVGEIALIIIGILFALKINNMNEDRKAEAEFDLYIVQLRADVQLAIESTEATITQAENRASAGTALFPLLQYPEIKAEQREVLENGLSFLGKFPRLQIDAGFLGDILNGDRDVITRNNELTRKAMDLERFVGRNMGYLVNIYEKINLASIGLLEFRGDNREELDIGMEYNFDEIRSSEKFLYTTQFIVSYTYSIAEISREIESQLNDFLTVLEEYE